eukprot:2795191-Rhodomonas_salina.2
MLVRVLISMFNETYAAASKNAENVWRIERGSAPLSHLPLFSIAPSLDPCARSHLTCFCALILPFFHPCLHVSGFVSDLLSPLLRLIMRFFGQAVSVAARAAHCLPGDVPWLISKLALAVRVRCPVLTSRELFQLDTCLWICPPLQASSASR